jgi:uncharacterized membrane protein
MANASIPTFVIGICVLSGLLLIAAGMPLWLRRVPPNSLYGVRFSSTLSDEGVWYEINARAGRNLVGIAVVYLALLTVALVFGRSWSMPIRLLGPTAIFVIALIINTIVLNVAGSRLLAARGTSKQS